MENFIIQINHISYINKTTIETQLIRTFLQNLFPFLQKVYTYRKNIRTRNTLLLIVLICVSPRDFVVSEFYCILYPIREP